MSSGRRGRPVCMKTEPATFAIVHGAGDVAASWDLVAAELRDRGHEVVAADLPCDDDSAGWTEYADAVADAVGERAPVVVVAHSLGGFPAPLLCSRLPVELLVLVAAMVPAPGERATDWWDSSGHLRAFRESGAHELGERELFLHDVPEDAALEALALGRDQSGTPMQEPWPLDAWPDVPTRYLLFRDDRFFPAEFVRAMVRERLGITPDEMDGSHMAYVSRPVELAYRLEACWAEVALAATAGRRRR
jgi:pimeloyl-ACP methyl ester carboxylesterase